MAKTDVWMPLYIADYLADTSRLTTVQHGAYLLLIMDYWRNGVLPDDDSILAQITKMQPDAWALIRTSIVRFFTIENGAFVHKRIESEKEKATGNKQAKSISGSIGASSKWGNSDNENKLKRSERLANARQLARHSSGEWDALKSVCGDACLICGSVETLVKDHIKPIYQGGSDGIDNLQPLCHSCNSSKGSDSTDHRPNDWQECLTKRLANASLTPNPSPSPSPSPIETPTATPSASPGNSKDLSAPSAQTAKTGTRLPADWVLPKTWGDFALSEKPNWTVDDVRRVADDFKDHWLANANQAKSKKADWFATWRKWVRSPLNEIKSAKVTQFQTASERRMAVTDKSIAEWLGDTNSGNTIDGECVNA